MIDLHENLQTRGFEMLLTHPLLPDRHRQLLSKVSVTPNELSELIDRTRAVVHEGIRTGEIPSITVGSTKNIPTTWILKTFGLTA